MAAHVLEGFLFLFFVELAVSVLVEAFEDIFLDSGREVLEVRPGMAAFTGLTAAPFFAVTPSFAAAPILHGGLCGFSFLFVEFAVTILVKLFEQTLVMTVPVAAAAFAGLVAAPSFAAAPILHGGLCGFPFFFIEFAVTVLVELLNNSLSCFRRKLAAMAFTFSRASLTFAPILHGGLCGFSFLFVEFAVTIFVKLFEQPLVMIVPVTAAAIASAFFSHLVHKFLGGTPFFFIQFAVTIFIEFLEQFSVNFIFSGTWSFAFYALFLG